MVSHRRSHVLARLLPLLLLACAPLEAQQERWQQLHERAQALFQEGKYEEEVAVAQQALQAAEAEFGGNDLRVAISANDLGDLYDATGKFAEAEAAYQRALKIREAALGPEHPAVAETLNGLAGVYADEGHLQQAEPLYQRALRIREKALGPEDPALAKTLSDLGQLNSDLGRYPEAEGLWQRALQIREKALGPGHRDVAMTLNNLGNLYVREGRYREGEAMLRGAAQTWEKALGPEHPDLSLALGNLGNLYEQEGRYPEAEAMYQRALRIQEKALGAEHALVAMTLNNLGTVFEDEGKNAEALPLFQRALAIDEKAHGAEHPDLAFVLDNLAIVYQDQGDYGQAEALTQRALRIREKALGPEHPDVALSLDDLALLYEEEGKKAEVEPLLQRALRIDEKALGPDDPGLTWYLDHLATFYQRSGDYARAGPVFERALAIRERLGPETPDVATSLSNLADLRFAQGLPEQAQLLYARAFDIRFHQFEYLFAFMTEKERLAFLGTVSGEFPAYFSFVHRFREKQPELIGRMYDLLLWEKGFIAGSETALRRQVQASGDAEALQLLDRLGSKRAQIAALLNAQPDDVEAWRKQIEQLEGEANQLEKALVARSAAFAQQKELERVTWQQVRAALRPGEAAVEFARFRYSNGTERTQESYYVALVVTPETRDHPAYVVLGEAKQLEGAPLAEFQQAVQARGVEAAAALLPGSRAYGLFWKPLEPLLAGRKRIYLSPDGVLNQMALGVMAAPDGKLLLEKHELRLVSSTKDLLRAAGKPAGNTAVLVGDPAFDLGEGQYRAALGAVSTGAPAAPVQMAMVAPGERSRDQGSGAELPPLPGTGAEVAAVSALLRQHGWQGSAYTGERALEEEVKRVRGPRLLHLATHGFFLADQRSRTRKSGGARPAALEDPMLRSGLFFAGADRALAGQATREDLDDGVLTAYEATSLDLQGTELVVLSACNTGQGEVKNGEGVFGLRRALQEAGAQAVMMSLWPVPDRETQELMTRFYQKWLAGVEKHEALRQAELEERAVVRKRYGRDLPYYWGAFVLVGR